MSDTFDAFEASPASVGAGFALPGSSGLPRGRRAVERSRRQNLYAATMLMPIAATLVLAVGKRAIRHFDGFEIVASAQAQQGAVRTSAPLSAQSAAAAAAGASSTPSPSTANAPGAVAPAATAPISAAGSGSSSAAVAVLLEQANYWRNQQQYDQAVESLNRALALDPRNVDALALTGQIQADRGNRSAAENALGRLRQASPGDPRIDKIDQALRVGPIQPEALSDARRLARDGKIAESVDRYNRVFRNNPPPDRLAVEYYQTLAGTEGGWEQARDGLARVVRQNPLDLKAQLAYAQLLTYREGARAEGIERLSQLAKNPAVSDQANQAWRQALGWLPDNKAAVDPLTVYLREHPNDADLANKLEVARNPPVDTKDPTAADRTAGFDALDKGRLADAAKSFQRAIDTNSNDADATGGLGIVKLRQKQFADAKTLLGRAISLDPEHRSRWEKALAGATQALAAPVATPGEGGNASAVAQQLLNRHDYPAAERELQRQIARNVDNSGGLQAMLGEAQSQQGRLGEAEASFREALGRNPRNAGALLGLANVLSREGRSPEAQGVLVQAEQLGAGAVAGQARAALLREQAQAASDLGSQITLYREAAAADPSSPWIRLDLARALVRAGRLNEARAVMAQAVAGRPSVDALKAGVIFANETNDPDAAARLVAQLPPSARTPDLQALQSQSTLKRDVAAALRLSPGLARSRLLSMAAQPDPDGARGSAIARALSALGEKVSARDAILVAESATPRQGAAAKLAYAGTFLEIGDEKDAQLMLGEIDDASISPAQRRQYAQLEAGLAVRTSDTLNEKGRRAEAYDRLAPELAQTPDNPDLNLALGRLYQGAKNPREAVRINEALLRRDPNNADIRRAAVGAALQAGDTGHADDLVQQGIELNPNDPRNWIASAEVAKARGNNRRALRDYERARDLRLQQLGYSDNGSDASTLPGVSLHPGAPAVYAPVLPTSRYAPSVVAPLAPSRSSSGNPDRGDDASTLPPARYRTAQASGPDTPLSAAPASLYPGRPDVPPGASYSSAPFSQAPAPSRPIGGAAASAGAGRNRLLDTTPNDLPAPSSLQPRQTTTGPAPSAAPVDLSAPPAATSAPAPVRSATLPAPRAPSTAASADETDRAIRERLESYRALDAQSTPAQSSPVPATRPVAQAPTPLAPTYAPNPVTPVAAAAPLPTSAPALLPIDPSDTGPFGRSASGRDGSVIVPRGATSSAYGDSFAPAAPRPVPTFTPPAYPASGYAPSGYPQTGYPQTGASQAGTGSPAYPQTGYAPPAYPPTPFGYRPVQYVSPAGGYQNTYQPYQGGQFQQPIQPQFQPVPGYPAPYQPPAPPPTPRVPDPTAGAFAPPTGPSVLTGSGQTGYYDNPFRRSPLAASPSPATAQGFELPTAGRADPLTEDIDKNIVALRDVNAPSLQGGFGFRNRSGDSGLDKLNELTIPLEANFSPGGFGRLKLSATPVILQSGTIGGDATNLQRFGTSVLSLTPPTAGSTVFVPVYTGKVPPDQRAEGVALAASYSVRDLALDVGSSPIGFKINHIVGGVEYAPRLTDKIGLRFTAERRAITDSILSYAGTTDTRTGNKWGGVVRDRAKANLEFSAGLADLYAGAGFGALTGTHVKSNTELEAGAGGTYPLIRNDNGQELRVGLDLVYFRYAKNLRFFTYGQGGYFSPQSYFAALIPVVYRDNIDQDLNYELGASIGVQNYHENSSNYFPLDPGLQQQLVVQQAGKQTTINGVQIAYPSRSQSGFAGTAHAALDYKVAPNFHLGARLNYQHSGNFDETTGLVYAKYIFNGTQTQ